MTTEYYCLTCKTTWLDKKGKQNGIYYGHCKNCFLKVHNEPFLITMFTVHTLGGKLEKLPPRGSTYDYP